MNTYSHPRGNPSGPRHAGSPGGFGGGGGRDRGRAEERPSIALDEVCFAAQPSPRLFAEVAERAAAEVAGGDTQKNKASQLRRFYDELVMWQEKVGRDSARFQECEPYIRMMKAKAAYAQGRDHVDANFRALFDRIVDQAKDADTLRQAKLFFEAFMAFYKVHRKQ